MAAGHGGYRTPTNPAPASGPGRLSRRTDGGPGQKLQNYTGGDYGNAQDTLQQERGAAMSQSGKITPMQVQALSNAAPAQDMQQGSPAPQIPFDAPTQRPNEPITHGVDIGPGAGSEALGIGATAQPNGSMTQLLQSLPDSTGMLANLLQAAMARGA